MNKTERTLIKEMKHKWAIQCKNGKLFCFLCGRQITSMEQCNADHWVPLSLGGKTNSENIKPAHTLCNSRKGCISPEEFLTHKEEILSGRYKKHKDKKPKNINKTNTISKTRQKPINKKIEKSKRKKTKNTSHTINQPYNIGATIYYIKENNTTPEFEVKQGIVIGITIKDTYPLVLVKDFYVDQNGKINSELIETTPLTQKQAEGIKKHCKNSTLQIMLNQKQLTR